MASTIARCSVCGAGTMTAQDDLDNLICHDCGALRFSEMLCPSLPEEERWIPADGAIITEWCDGRVSVAQRFLGTPDMPPDLASVRRVWVTVYDSTDGHWHRQRIHSPEEIDVTTIGTSSN